MLSTVVCYTTWRKPCRKLSRYLVCNWLFFLSLLRLHETTFQIILIGLQLPVLYISINLVIISFGIQLESKLQYSNCQPTDKKLKIFSFLSYMAKKRSKSPLMRCSDHIMFDILGWETTEIYNKLSKQLVRHLLTTCCSSNLIWHVKGQQVFLKIPLTVFHSPQWCLQICCLVQRTQRHSLNMKHSKSSHLWS